MDDFIRQEDDSQIETYDAPAPKLQPEPVAQPVQEAEKPIEAPKIETENKSMLDTELEEMLARQRAKIKVVGAGGGGNNTINRITEVGIHGAETIAVNADAQDLLYTKAEKKILIGREATQEMGAG